MIREVPAQGIVEQFQQILECDGVCLMLGCLDPDLRHPLLNFWQTENAMSVVCASGLFAVDQWEDMLKNEHIRGLCDLAMQSGRMQVLEGSRPFLGCWRVQSVAAMPLEQSAGVLGAILLVDGQSERFGRGEERLLYASRDMYTKALADELWEQLRLQALECQMCECRDAELDRHSKSKFVSMVSHELRGPLGIIRGYAQLLQVYGIAREQRDPELTPDRQRQYLEAIMEQTRLMELLVNDLLDSSRLQPGGLALCLGCVDVSVLCRQVVQIGQMRADQQAPGKHRLACKIAVPLPSVWADADRLRQVLFNIIENAIKYSPEGGYIELKASCPEKSAFGNQPEKAQVHLTICDQGIGIPPSHIAHLFRPFERLERPEIACIAGSGLGLYIARQLVEAMDGSIQIQSQPNQGTTVTITLLQGDSMRVIVDKNQAQMASLLVR
jgi:signal transduction histidine kinase